MHEFRLTPSELSDIYERLGLGLPTFRSANSPLVLNPNFDEELQPGSAVYDANTGRPSKAGKRRADGELAEDSAVKRGKRRRQESDSEEDKDEEDEEEDDEDDVVGSSRDDDEDGEDQVPVPVPSRVPVVASSSGSRPLRVRPSSPIASTSRIPASPAVPLPTPVPSTSEEKYSREDLLRFLSLGKFLPPVVCPWLTFCSFA